MASHTWYFINVTEINGQSYWATDIPVELQPLYSAIRGCTSCSDLVRKKGRCGISVEDLLEALLYESAMDDLLRKLNKCYKDGQFHHLDPRSFELESGCVFTSDLLDAKEDSVFIFYRA